MKNKIVAFCWIEKSFVKHLENLRQRYIHLPTRTMIVRLIIDKGLNAVGAGKIIDELVLRPTRRETRAPFAVSLSNKQRRYLNKIVSIRPDASSFSAALRLVLWLGLNLLAAEHQRASTKYSV